ncbi:Isochorismatase family protein YecD [Poriferisphaera corsica]|uniref:Isochorismatase family protein YecD n=1 Tax=Poriferisphaera corsica TaxID=2528020 RepID=A0A517YYG8_9BACT|nr:isochorismatase family protein [Poriferisphaera corsica]QDU35270.1 Isochorismatase family protein YecD [Poriferisphaera corsica]
MPSFTTKLSVKQTSLTLGACALVGTLATTMLLSTSSVDAKPSSLKKVEASAHPGGKPEAPLPKYDIKLDPNRVAVVITDPQNDFLSPNGVTWGVVGESVTENNTVQHIHDLFVTAQSNNIPVFVSPHYYYKHDHTWKFEGALESLMHQIGMFDRPNALDLTNFENSGADWLDQYKPYINNKNTTVTSPHKVYGPETNDLILQLRKQGIDQVILAGMSANLCTEAHMRELVEQGFEVIVAADATAAAKLPHYDGYEAAYINFRFIANGVWTTDQAVIELNKAGRAKK